MNDQVLMDMIKRRMQRLCVEEYSIEPVLFETTSTPQTISLDAFNEHYFLANIYLTTSEAIIVQATIESDDNYYLWQNNAKYTTRKFSQYQKFTGQIKITSNRSATYFEFLRVIPHKNCCSKNCSCHTSNAVK